MPPKNDNYTEAEAADMRKLVSGNPRHTFRAELAAAYRTINALIAIGNTPRVLDFYQQSIAEADQYGKDETSLSRQRTGQAGRTDTMSQEVNTLRQAMPELAKLLDFALPAIGVKPDYQEAEPGEDDYHVADGIYVMHVDPFERYVITGTTYYPGNRDTPPDSDVFEIGVATTIVEVARIIANHLVEKNVSNAIQCYGESKWAEEEANADGAPVMADLESHEYQGHQDIADGGTIVRD